VLYGAKISPINVFDKQYFVLYYAEPCRSVLQLPKKNPATKPPIMGGYFFLLAFRFLALGFSAIVWCLLSQNDTV
jgi:hypothetical protein